MRTKITSAIVLASLLVFGAAPAAQAAPESYCPSGATCLWQDHTYLTNGSPSAYIWFQQCANVFWVLKYRGTTKAADDPRSVYNNGNYDTVSIYANQNYAILGPTLSLFKRSLAKKTGDGNVTNNAGLIANFDTPQSGRFNSVPETCKN